jgi:hypothetical protein
VELGSRFLVRRVTLNTLWILIYGSLLTYVLYLRFFAASHEAKVRDAVVDVLRYEEAAVLCGHTFL